MDWVRHKLALESGKTIKIRPRGNSMEPIIKSGQLLTIESAWFIGYVINEGDIVLCKVKGAYYVHKVTGVRKISPQKESYQIGNMRGHMNGWIPRSQIYGRVVSIDD